jgi:hypothetical protein
MMEQNADGWPEITYRYIEHYYWEPQHLFHKMDSEKANTGGEKPVEVVYRRLRSQETPLNYLLNILLRLAPAAIRRACLEPFGIDLSDDGLASLVVKTPGEFKGDGLKTQPDVHLESETARVFIEVKVNASLTLQQIKKYVHLHAELNKNGGQAKRPYVLFLVQSDELQIPGIESELNHDNVGKVRTTRLAPEANGVTFGLTTWEKFARILSEELDRRQSDQNEAAEMLTTLIGDFLADLNRRAAKAKSLRAAS